MSSTITPILFNLLVIIFFVSGRTTIVHSRNSNLTTKWPQGGGFASGCIDLGGLLVSQVTTFTKIWAINGGGQDDLGVSFYNPVKIPQGFTSLGSYAQQNNIPPLSVHILVAKDVSNNSSKPTLKPPIDYFLVWSSESLDIKKAGDGYIWLPVAPDGYKPIGYVVSGLSDKPPLDKVNCVREDFVNTINVTSGNLKSDNGINLNGLKVGDSNGGFIVQNMSVGYLKGNLSNSMPNLNQVKALIQAYAPVIHFHPDEQYLPSSVDWFFQNGALLYHKGDASKPTRIEKNGSNLPQDGSDDDTYWLDIPQDGSNKDRVKKGDLQSACAYFHVKPVWGGLFTDIAVWVFYPFNGASRAKLEFLDIILDKFGEHVGDWEHVTLRINNINGELSSVFFSQHSWGKWISASELEYHTGNKPKVYASRHGHASYPKPGCVLFGFGVSDIGLSDDTAKGDKVMDTGVGAVVIAAEYMNGEVVEPPWLNYERKWGPKIDYDVDKVLEKAKKAVTGKLKKGFDKLVKIIPREMLGEEGPTGPKVKNNWSGDEQGFQNRNITHDCFPQDETKTILYWIEITMQILNGGLVILGCVIMKRVYT